jgi:hypothetical protein
MRHRTYYVRMPTVAGQMPYVDVFVGGQSVGSPAAPVGFGAGLTVPPPGWQTGADFLSAPDGKGDGQFFESRSLPLRVEDGESGVLRLGYTLAIVPVDPSNDCPMIPRVLISQTLFGGGLTGVFVGMQIPDPSYGPAFRLMNTADTAGILYCINTVVYNAREEDRAAFGG